MRRRLLPVILTFICALSLLICTLALAGWMVRNLRGDSWTYDRTGPGATADQMTLFSGGINLSAGYLGILSRHSLCNRERIANDGLVVHDVIDTREPPGLPIYADPRIVLRHVELFRCSYETENLIAGRQWIRMWFLRLPLLGIAAVFAIPPLIWELNHRRRVARFARSRQGQCRACGYDLRESPERCPECGTVPQRRWSWPDRLLHSPVTRLRR